MIASWMNDDVLVSNGFLVAAALLLLAGLRAIASTRHWLTRVVRTEGEIVAWIEGENDSGVTFVAVYRYAGIENDIVGGNQIGSRKPVIGARATIYYDPLHPTNAFLEGSKAFWMFPGCLLFVAMGMIVGAILVRFDSRW